MALAVAHTYRHIYVLAFELFSYILISILLYCCLEIFHSLVSHKLINLCYRRKRMAQPTQMKWLWTIFYRVPCMFLVYLNPHIDRFRLEYCTLVACICIHFPHTSAFATISVVIMPLLKLNPNQMCCLYLILVFSEEQDTGKWWSAIVVAFIPWKIQCRSSPILLLGKFIFSLAVFL